MFFRASPIIMKTFFKHRDEAASHVDLQIQDFSCVCVLSNGPLGISLVVAVCPDI